MFSSRSRLNSAVILLVLLQVLVFAPAASAGGPVIHIVTRGETLYAISARYGVNMYRVAEVNHLTNLNTIYAGQRLLIPTGAGAPASCPARYRIQRGDNLFRIAARFGVSVWQLQQWNGIGNPDRIKAGQELVIFPPGCSEPHPGPGPGSDSDWLAQYYGNRDLAGAPILARREANPIHDWGYGSPAPSVPTDNFSARWTRTLQMSGGTYRFTVRSDDGVRLSVDGIRILDAWKVQSATVYTVDVIVASGVRTIMVEYFEAEGLSEIAVEWVKR